MSAPSAMLSARLPLVLGYAALFLLLGGLGAWSLGVKIAGAVVAQGTVDVESDLQVVKHADGGVVGEIFVEEGDLVAAGEVLIRLDDTFLRSELAIVEGQLYELAVRGTRLAAERDGRERIDVWRVPAKFNLAPAWTDAQIEGQRQLFDARRERVEKEVAQLREQQRQSQNRADGYSAEIASISERIALIEEELEDQQALLQRNLVSINRVRELRRTDAQLEGARSRRTAEVAEARSEIAEIEMQILQLRGKRQEDAIAELRDLRYAEIELRERRLTIREQLSRLDIRAPVAGRVFDMKIAAARAVVRPAEPVMQLVPDAQAMRIKAYIDPVHIEQIYPGQDVSMRFTSFNVRTTPQIPGTVHRISADVIVDPTTGARHYEVIVAPDSDALDATPELAMLPGMPVEAFIATEPRRPLEYLVRPLADYFHRAWRD